MTNCPNCGAPYHGHKCEYCGTIIPEYEKLMEYYQSKIDHLQISIANAEQTALLIASMGKWTSSPCTHCLME